MGKYKMDWVCCQMGSREYYAIPRSLYSNGCKITLITDIWFEENNINKLFNKYITKRFHPDLKQQDVISFNKYFLKQLILKKTGIIKPSPFDLKFEIKTAQCIEKMKWDKTDIKAFSYSYTALKIFEICKKNGLKTFLGQINPGPGEADIVQKEYFEEFGKKYSPKLPSENYWERWRDECALSDKIIVNSEWSKKLIINENIQPEKINILPLAFERESSNNFIKNYPNTFNIHRRMKILYLGNISIRKGFHLLKKTMVKLINLPVILDVVGKLNGPKELLQDLPINIAYHGRKVGDEKDKYYKDADVFILPTLSDGFAITQLEAQFWHLPLIVSNRCGEVVKDDVNGIVIPEINVETIMEVILRLYHNPDILKRYSMNTIDMRFFSLKSIGEKLISFSR